MMRLLRTARWSPYLVGAGIGALSWITFLLMGKALGVSTTFVSAAGALEGTVAPDHVRANPYLAKYVVDSPTVDWQFALVLMLAVGALIATRLAGEKRRVRVPALWAGRFGPSVRKRYFAAFAGGAVLLFGARLAGGCTSGHAVSGGLQLAVSSWMFVLAMFTSGVATALLLYRKGGHRV